MLFYAAFLSLDISIRHIAIIIMLPFYFRYHFDIAARCHADAIILLLLRFAMLFDYRRALFTPPPLSIFTAAPC